MNRFYRGTGVEHAVRHQDVVARARASVAASVIAEQTQARSITEGSFAERCVGASIAARDRLLG